MHEALLRIEQFYLQWKVHGPQHTPPPICTAFIYDIDNAIWQLAELVIVIITGT